MLLQREQVQFPDPQQTVTDAEVAYFKDNGFVLPKVGLPKEATAELRRLVENVLVDNQGKGSIIRMPYVPNRPGQGEGVIGGEDIFKIAMHPTILATVSRLVSKNLILWSGEIFAKAAGSGVRTPWHQDCYVPTVKAGPGRDQPRVAMVWIAVDDVGLDNGCVRFIPGSGNGKRLNYIPRDQTTNLLSFEVDGKTINEETAVDGILPSGNFSCHDMFVVHGAKPNLSGRRRVGIAFHYMAADDAYDRSFAAVKTQGGAEPLPIEMRPIWQVLGENKNPINDFVIGHKNLEDVDQYAEAARQKLSHLYC